MKRILFQGDSITDAGWCLLDAEWYVGQSCATMSSGCPGMDQSEWMKAFEKIQEVE